MDEELLLNGAAAKKRKSFKAAGMVASRHGKSMEWENESKKYVLDGEEEEKR